MSRKERGGEWKRRLKEQEGWIETEREEAGGQEAEAGSRPRERKPAVKKLERDRD